MSRTVTVGFDGSPQSRAAADWAAREAGLRALPLKVLHVRSPVPGNSWAARPRASTACSKPPPRSDPGSAVQIHPH
ncbi:universal stress protein, partial [Streptomyces sp. NPDC048279]|uniref:universal stress protein n=1 Tax=Streptomyces sp. NPDC048279 TaxID=3154714 RepID=UPI0034133C11